LRAEERTISSSARRAVLALASAQALLFALLGLARYATFHNTTFDLAFYTRIAWGLTHQHFWEPMVNAHIYGLHLSPILVPLGALGALFGTAPVLVCAQAAALAGAALPIAKIAVRHVGSAGAIAAAIAFLFYPNLGHVAGDEFHPGSLAVLPLAWMAYAIDRGSARALALGALGVLLCREDLALVTALACVPFVLKHRARWRAAAAVAGVSIAYALFFFLVLHPAYAPEVGSLELHFGRFGSSPLEVAVFLLTHPGELFAHLATLERITYVPKILAPLALLPLLRPAWLVPVLPIVAINLLSAWPTATDLEVHYLTPAIPFFVAAASEAAGPMARRFPIFALTVLAMPVLVSHLIAGGTPLSLDYPRDAFLPDHNTAAARAIVEAVGPERSVQAPDALLSHIAERESLHRIASPEAGDDFTVLDVWHRRAYAGDEDLLRTTEEPFVRSFLGRTDHRVVVARGDYVLLERGRSPRDGLAGHAILGRVDPERGAPIAACLAVLDARWQDGNLLAIDFVARAACPNDLAIRLGADERPTRVDLLFGGILSPQHLERGDHLRSLHRMSDAERARIEAGGLRVGALRSSGARPEPRDPTSVAVPLE
jgi:uncharacterized membrane protein